INHESRDLEEEIIPATTSMLIRRADWIQQFTKDTTIPSEQEISNYLRNESQSSPHCQLTKPSFFWTQFALSGMNLVTVPLPLLQTNQIIRRTPACHLDLRKVRNPQDTRHLTTLAKLKQKWRPSVSVIVPYYNVPHPHWLIETLMCLSMQSFVDFEIIIVDDGSRKGHISRLLLDEMSEIVKQSNGWWDSTTYPKTTIPPRARLFEDVEFDSTLPRTPTNTPPKASTNETKQLPLSIPFRIIRHTNNLGLSEARNTGVRVARGHLVTFLDPDDLITPTALEKLTLASITSVEKPLRNSDSVIAFVHPGGIVHFQEDFINITKNQPPTIKTTKEVYTAYSPTQLLNENTLTSMAIISKQHYIKAGGMCPRTTLHYFEDYDFWLRMLGMGMVGTTVREPLFWYRRHGLGQSTGIAKASERDAASGGFGIRGMVRFWKRMMKGEEESEKRRSESVSKSATEEPWRFELRRNNPLVYGDVTPHDAKEFLKFRDEGNPKFATFMQCHRRFDPVDYEIWPYLSSFAEWRREFMKSYGESLKLAAGSDKFDLVEREYRVIYPPHIFPYNLRHLSSLTSPTAESSVAYMIPWMVTGGADLYDAHVVKSLSDQHLNKQHNHQIHTTLLVARHIESHPWSKMYHNNVNERLTNDTNSANRILDYIVESRFVSMVVNSRTIAGYDAFERWGKEVNITVGGADDDNGNRVCGINVNDANCVSMKTELGRPHLRDHLVNVLGHGDAILGRVGKDRGIPLLSSEAEKIRVAEPPLDLEEWVQSCRAMWLDHAETGHDEFDDQLWEDLISPTVHFIGRLDEQKDPWMWVDVSVRAAEILMDRREEYAKKLKLDGILPAPILNIVGSGALEAVIQKRLRLARASGKLQFTEDRELDVGTQASQKSNRQIPLVAMQPSVPHNRIADTVLASKTRHWNSVTLLTSGWEGLPIVVMESLGVGVPVITTNCGGIREVMEWEGWPWLNDNAGDDNVGNLTLGRVMDIDCGGGTGSDRNARNHVVELMASEVAGIWESVEKATLQVLAKGGATESGPKFSKKAYLKQVLGLRRRRWRASEGFRTMFGAEEFRRRWRDDVERHL
ncbi:hypothetical protein HDU76_004192, partial [Blyttiomyces sp. JEL0837]